MFHNPGGDWHPGRGVRSKPTKAQRERKVASCCVIRRRPCCFPRGWRKQILVGLLETFLQSLSKLFCCVVYSLTLKFNKCVSNCLNKIFFLVKDCWTTLVYIYEYIYVYVDCFLVVPIDSTHNNADMAWLGCLKRESCVPFSKYLQYLILFDSIYIILFVAAWNFFQILHLFWWNFSWCISPPDLSVKYCSCGPDPLYHLGPIPKWRQLVRFKLLWLLTRLCSPINHGTTMKDGFWTEDESDKPVYIYIYVCIICMHTIYIYTVNILYVTWFWKNMYIYPTVSNHHLNKKTNSPRLHFFSAFPRFVHRVASHSLKTSANQPM